MKASTPRLRLTTRSETGEVSVIGDFADGPRGRQDAEKAYSNADGSVFLDRVFTDGSTQALIRIPQNLDGWTLSKDEAKQVEFDRAWKFLGSGPGQVSTPPLTRLEQLAATAFTENWSMGHARRRQGQLAELLGQVYGEQIALLKREALARTSTTQRPQDSDLASPDEALARRSSGRRM